MNIKTKFKLGDKVYAIYKEAKKVTVEIFDTTVVEIIINDSGILYYVDKIYEEFKEEELYKIDDKKGMIDRIDYLLNESERMENAN